jgi:outer membrane lipoprotein-sorting protein
MGWFSCLFVCLILQLTNVSVGMAEMHEQLRSVQGDFIQEKHLKILTRPLVSHGTFTFQAPQSLRWEYHDPLHSIMFMHKGKMEKIIERDGHFEQDNGIRSGSMQVILPEISSWLDGRFTDNPVLKATRIDEHTIVLTPKEQGLQAVISSIELRLGQQEGVMEAVTIFEGADSFTRLNFTNVILNREIPESFFSRP